MSTVYSKRVMKYYRIKYAIIIAAVVSLTLVSCWVYTFSPSVAGGANSIAVAKIDNNTAEYGLEDLLIDGLNDEFERDNTLKVVPESQADLIITGSVKNYQHEPYTYDETETVTEYVCRITLEIIIGYADSEKILWEDPGLADFGIYAPGDGETQADGNKRAVDKIINEIMNRTVRGW